MDDETDMFIQAVNEDLFTEPPKRFKRKIKQNNIISTECKISKIEDINSYLSRLGNVPVNINQTYNIIECKNINTAMNNFIAKNSKYLSQSYKNGYGLINNITSTVYYFDYQFELTLNLLREYFPNGHAFAIDATSTPIVQFMIDVDCTLCKESNCNYSPNITVYEKIANKVYSLVKNKITSLPDNGLFYIYKRSSNCGVHIYYEFSVSNLYYDILLTELSKITLEPSNLFIDYVTSLPLPLSAKNDNSCYHLISSTHNHLHNYAPSISNYYDINYIATNIKASNIHIGEFENETSDDWSNIITNNMNYICATSLEPISKYLISPTLSKLKLKTNKLISQYKIFSKFINENYTVSVDYDITFTNLEYIDNLINDDEISEIVQICVRLFNIVAKHTYNYKPNIPTIELFKYYIQLMLFDDGKYIFYILISTLIIIIKNLGHTGDYDKHKNKILTLFKNLIHNCIVCDNTLTTDILYNIDCLIKYDCYIALQDVFQKPLDVLKHITIMCKHKLVKNYDDNYKKLLTEYVSIIDISENNISKYIKDALDTTLFVYVHGKRCIQFDFETHYQELSLQQYTDLIKRLTNQTKQILTQHKLEKTVIACGLSSLIQYTPKRIKIDLVGGSYTHFIGVYNGVFNNITGLNMKSIPHLHFETYRSNVVSNLDGTPLNIEDINKWVYIVKTLLDNKDKILIDSVVIPGLLKFEDVKESSYNICLKSIHSILINTTYYDISPLIEYYNFNINSVLSICNALNKLIQTATLIELKNIMILFKKDQTNLNDFDINSEYLVENYDKQIDYTKSIDELAHYYNIPLPLFSLGYCVAIICYYSSNVSFIDYIKLESLEKDQDYLNRINKNTYFITGDKFSSDDYHISNNNNIIRVLMHILPNLYTEIYTSLASLIVAFNYDITYKFDFLKHTSLLLQPLNSMKKMIILHGNKNTSKSYIVDSLRLCSNPSFTSSIAAIKKEESSTSEKTIANISNYLAVFHEVSYITDSYIKTITGGDVLCERLIYSKLGQIIPISLVVVTCNDLPICSEAGSAAQHRLAIFKFENMLVNYNEYKNEHNQLLLYSIKSSIIPKNTSKKHVSIVLNNLMYGVFKLYVDNQCNITPTLLNHKSINAINAFMFKNNTIYKILNAAKIKCGPNRRISSTELKNKIEAILPAITFSNKPVDYSEFKYRFDRLFKDGKCIMIENGVEYYDDVGDLICVNDNEDVNYKIKIDDSKHTTIREIKQHAISNGLDYTKLLSTIKQNCIYNSNTKSYNVSL